MSQHPQTKTTCSVWSFLTPVPGSVPATQPTLSKTHRRPNEANRPRLHATEVLLLLLCLAGGWLLTTCTCCCWCCCCCCCQWWWWWRRWWWIIVGLFLLGLLFVCFCLFLISLFQDFWIPTCVLAISTLNDEGIRNTFCLKCGGWIESL